MAASFIFPDRLTWSAARTARQQTKNVLAIIDELLAEAGTVKAAYFALLSIWPISAIFKI